MGSRRAWTLALAVIVSAFTYTPAAEASACTCGFSDGKFKLATITIDGNLADWTSTGVLADTDNNVCDAPSTSAPTELGGADSVADAPQSEGRNLTWFSFTWDATNIYFFTERNGGSNNIQRFVYYGDTNNDGLLQTGERVIQVEWQGNTRLVQLYRATYNAVAVGGDSLADTSGVADGYKMPGNLTQLDALNSPLRSGNWGSADGLMMEFRVTWTELTGSATPRAVRFHVSSLNANFNGSNPPGGIEDNMAGCGGGTGSTQFADGDISPTTSSVAHLLNQLVCASTIVTNDGNANDTFELTNNAASVFYDDGTVHPTTSYYTDVNANGVYDSGTDTALTNTNASGGVDTGVLAPLATKRILVCSTNATNPNVYTPYGDAVVVTTLTSVFNPLVTFTHTQTIAVTLLASPTLTKTSAVVSDPSNGGTNPKRIPGSFVDYTITASNAGGGAINNNTTVITDPIPANTELYVNSLGGSPTNSPVTQTAGTPSCGLTLSFSSAGTQALRLADLTDNIDFSTDNGATWTATPTPDGNGVSAAVTNIRIRPQGVFAATSASGTPSCSWTFRVRVK